jgi:hypothetical protein
MPKTKRRFIERSGAEVAIDDGPLTAAVEANEDGTLSVDGATASAADACVSAACTFARSDAIGSVVVGVVTSEAARGGKFTLRNTLLLWLPGC